MRIRSCKTIDVEFEADVNVDDLLYEMGARIDEGEDFPRRLVSTIDVLTRMLARVEGDWIAAMKPEHRAEIANRLEAQLGRYRKK